MGLTTSWPGAQFSGQSLCCMDISGLAAHRPAWPSPVPKPKTESRCGKSMRSLSDVPFLTLLRVVGSSCPYFDLEDRKSAKHDCILSASAPRTRASSAQSRSRFGLIDQDKLKATEKTLKKRPCTWFSAQANHVVARMYSCFLKLTSKISTYLRG